MDVRGALILAAVAMAASAPTAALSQLAMDDDAPAPAPAQAAMVNGLMDAHRKLAGIMGTQPDAAATAAEMARLYAMALENDEMRSHLPDRLQMQMGKRPFMYEHTFYCWGGCIWDVKQRYKGFWDHEAYRRSVGEDRGAVCARAYYDLVSRVGWLRDGAYWLTYLKECSWIHSDIVNREFAPLVEGISRECEMRVIEGWFVVAGGEFIRHGGPVEGDPLFNGTTAITKLRPKGVPPEPGFPLFAKACLEESSTIKTAASRHNVRHSEIHDHPYKHPPEYAPTDPLGDWAEAPEARAARELGSRLADLYGVAMGSAEVRSHLPSEVRDAISLDVPETYYVDDAMYTDVGGSNKYHPLALILPDIFTPPEVLMSDMDPQFCRYRPDLHALCG